MAQATVTETSGLTHTDVVNTYNGNATDAETRFTALEGAPSRLTVVAGTDADVTMIQNRHYEFPASLSLTANRIRKLPVPSAVGARCRVSLTSNASYSTYSVIIQGDATVTVNNGTAATEHTRLLCPNEYIEYRATTLTNWDVWDDGRRYLPTELRLAANVTSLSTGAYSLFPWDTEFRQGAFLTTLASDTVTVRRNANVVVAGILGLNLGGVTALVIRCNSTDYLLMQADYPASFGSKVVTFYRELPFVAGDVLSLRLFQNSGSTAIALAGSLFTLRETP